MSLLVPCVIFKDVTRIQPEYLHAHGIKALVLDVDNTLTAHGSQTLQPNIAAWLQKMHNTGIKLMLGSNNTKKRVTPFAKNLGLPFASLCCKPSPIWLLCAMHQFRMPKSQIALVGDQLFTDYLAGKLYGANVLLVRPTYKDTKKTILLRRKFESPFIAEYYKTGGKLR